MRNVATRAFTSLTIAGLGGLVVLLAACPPGPVEPPADGGPDGIGCKLEYAGDEDADMELQIVTLDPSYAAQPFADGGDASILIPPQGGRVVFVGVRAKNLDPCGVRLAGAIRDPATDQVRIDTRTVNLEPADDGWSESDPTDISTFSNIPVCSNNWAETDVFDQTFTLVVSVKDRDGKLAMTEMSIVPRCDEKTIIDGKDIQKECLCICQKDYVTGQSCDIMP